MANRWGGGGTETEADLIFLGFKITVDSERSHRIKRHLLLGRKTMTNLERILKSGDIMLPTRIRARVPRTARRSNQSILSQA